MKVQTIVPGHLYCITALYRGRPICRAVKAKSKFDAVMALVDQLSQLEAA